MVWLSLRLRRLLLFGQRSDLHNRVLIRRLLAGRCLLTLLNSLRLLLLRLLLLLLRSPRFLFGGRPTVLTKRHTNSSECNATPCTSDEHNRDNLCRSTTNRFRKQRRRLL